ncbi:synaptotagmin-like protein 3 [Rhinoraja longicauda]
MNLEIDIKSLKDRERDKVLEVLQRDEMLRKVEEERIRKLKSEYQEIRRKGAKSCSREYSSHSCARCQAALGLLFNKGVECSVCSHQVCDGCSIHNSNKVARCVVCHAHGLVKVKSGEWFIEERAKKFSLEQGEHKTISEKLLQTFRSLSIAVVPPTPPPTGCQLLPTSGSSLAIGRTGDAGEESSRLQQESTSSICPGSETMDKANVTGEIELSIRYNFEALALEIHIKACKNLAPGDGKKRNPYVKTYLLPDKSPHSKLKSSVKRNTVDPVFNETLQYTIGRRQVETKTLHVSVWYSTTLKRQLCVGQVHVPFDSWRFEDSSTQLFQWYQLQGVTSAPDPGPH